MRDEQTRNRWLIYGGGILIQNVGLYLNARCGLGTSALLGVAYVGGLAWNISFGNASLVIYCIYILTQLIIRGKNRQWRDLLQLPLALMISRVYNLLDLVLGAAVIQANVIRQILALLMGICLNGIGATLAVNMRLIPTPGDGLVQAFSDRFGVELGLMKNIVDISCVTLAAVMSLAFLGRLDGVGIGTVAAMLLVGRIIFLTNRLIGDRIRAAAGMQK